MLTDTKNSSLHTATSIDISRLSVDFGTSTPIFSDLDLTVNKGEFLAIVGGSGCGKTTLMNVVAGLVAIANGRVSVNGEAPRSGRADIAYILARDALLPWRTVRGNVEYALGLSGVDKASRRKIATEYLAQVGLKDHMNKYPAMLSQGQRQRVSLARAFSVNRSIYLLDEPFSALDAQTKHRLHEQLLDLWERDRKTVVFVTHDMGEAVALADRVIVMAPNRGIVDEIPIDLPRPRSVLALQNNERYHELYRQVAQSLSGGM